MHQVVIRYLNNFPEDGMLTSKPYIFNIQTDKNTIIAVETFNHYQQAKQQWRKALFGM